jgi:septum formation protein
MNLVLASASPRRQELLADLGLVFAVRPADIDESVHSGELGTDYVLRLAREKAAAVAGTGELVIAADTTVDLNGELLGKPVDEDDARALMRKLSNSVHHVHTGVCALAIDADGTVRDESTVITTAVSFAPVPDAWIDWYSATGEPFDKAGGYGMQGSAAIFVHRIDGSPTNVIGLPLDATASLVARLGYDLFSFSS